MARTARKKIAIRDEGVILIDDVDSIDFTGDGVTGTASGSDITETISGADIPTNTNPQTTTYTALTTDDVITADGTFTITLYTAVGNNGRKLTIKNIGTGTITIDGNGSQTIDGSLTAVIYVQNVSLVLVSNNTNWLII